MKNMKRFALVLALTLLLGMLSGCDLSQIMKFGKEMGISGKQSVKLTGTVYCYEEPSRDAKILATFSNGLEVEYSEVTMDGEDQWVQTQHGWTLLNPRDEQIVVTEAVELREGFVREQLRVRSGAGTGYEQVTQMTPGTQVYVGRTVYADQALWGETEQGWICLDYVYFVEEEGKNPGYAVVRETGAEVYDLILGFRNTRKSLEVGQRLTVLEQLETNDGELWIYASGGWINGADIYVEGTVGKRPCDGIVIDKTPLNVRIGPGTDFEAVNALPNGTYVQVLEQIKRNKHDWGFTGEGWIYMDNVDKDFRNATEVEETVGWETIATTP